MEKGSKQNETKRTVIVVEKSNDWAGKKHDENFEGGDPCNCARGVMMELIRLVVALEDADTVDPSKGAKQAAKGSSEG